MRPPKDARKNGGKSEAWQTSRRECSRGGACSGKRGISPSAEVRTSLHLASPRKPALFVAGRRACPERARAQRERVEWGSAELPTSSGGPGKNSRVPNLKSRPWRF